MKSHLENKNILIFFVFVIFGALVYSNSLKAPFYFDDIENITDNHQLRIDNVSFQNIKNAAFSAPSSNRPIANLSFALNYYFHQHDVRAYHVINILIHIATGIILFLLIQSTLVIAKHPAEPSIRNQIAFFAVFIWLVHPIQTQSVTYIVQRMNSMAAMFFVLAMFSYVRGRLAALHNGTSRPWFAGSFLAGLLAVGSKENAAILPFIIVLYEWYFFQDLKGEWLKKRLPYVLGAITVFGLMVFVFLGENPVQAILSGYGHRDFSLQERLLTEFRVVLYYVGLLVAPYPSRLNLDYDFAVSQSIVTPITTLLSVAAVGALFGLAVYLAKRERLLSFCILWFLGTLVIESSIIPLEIIFEHRLYLPSMFFFLVVTVLTYRFVRLKWAAPCLLLGAVLLLSYWTLERNIVWRDPLVFWQDCVSKSPNKARSRSQLGLELYGKGRLFEAIVQFNEALRIDPLNIMAHNNLGNALQAQGRLDEAILHYSQVLLHEPDNVKAHNNLGNIHARMGNFDKAVSHLMRALHGNPMNAEAHNNLGNILQLQGRLNEAIGHYREALRLKPYYENARFNMNIAIQKADKESRHNVP